MIQTHGQDPGDEDRFAARRTGGTTDNFELTALRPGQHLDWMRLDRVGGRVTGYMSSSDEDWLEMGSVSWDSNPPAELLVGLAVNSHSTDGCEPASLVFDEVRIAGSFSEFDSFRRGDADGNGVVEITDAIRILLFLFVEQIVLPCMDAADADDDEILRLTDAIRILGVLFLESAPLPTPGFSGPCGVDPTPGLGGTSLGCDGNSGCR